MLKNKLFRFLGQGVLFGILGVGSVYGDFFSNRDNATRGPELLKWDPSARSAGLGGAYAGVANDLGALYWNPAGLQQLERPELQLSHTRVYGDQSISVAGVGWPTWRGGHRETWGLGVTYSAMDPFDVVSQNSTVGQARVSEGVASLSYARPLGPSQLGVTAKFVTQDLYIAQGQTYALDVGILQKSEDSRWTWGVSAANMGPSMTLGNKNIGLPLVLRTGVSRLFPIGARGQWIFTVQGDVPIDDTVQGHGGVEYQTEIGGDWRAAVRGGIQTQEAQGRWALGANLERGPLVLHYTFSENADLGAINRFELSIKFGSPLAQETQRRTWIRQAQTALQAGNIPLAQESLDRLKTLSPVDREAEKLRQSVRSAQWETLDPVLLLQQGRQALTAGDPDSAAVFFRKLLIVQPDHAEGVAELEKTEKTIAARRLAQTRQQVIQQRDSRVKKLLEWAREESRSGRWENALPRWQEVLSLEKNNSTALAGISQYRKMIYGEALSAQEAGEMDRARQLFQKLHAIGGPLEDSAQRLKSMEESQKEKKRQRSAQAYQEGKDAYRKGKLKEAQSLFREALAGQPQDKSIQRALERVEEELRHRGTP